MPFSLGDVLLTLLASGLVQTSADALDPHGPPRVDRNPMFLDSFVPSAMQIISHATELMKYEIPATETPPSTAAPSTSSHRPGIFAPDPSRPPSFYYKIGESPHLGNDYKGWVYSLREKGRKIENEPRPFGNLHNDLYEKVNGVNEENENLNEDERVDKFLEDYDDLKETFLRKKKPPPPKAYVTLLSLYDSLNREAKKLGMNKYAGYTTNVLEDLSDFSKGTSANQMKEIFTKIVERKEVKQESTVKSLKTIIEDLNNPKSYINDALKFIPPLIFNYYF